MSIYKTNMKEVRKHTDKELAEAHIFPSRLSPAEKKEAEKEFSEFRKQRLLQMTEKDHIYSRIVQLKYIIEDYTKSNNYNSTYTFSHFLKEYIHSINKKNTDFSKEISLHVTKLSRLLNNKEVPNDKIFVRLELHSNNIIQAVSWYRLLKKQKELELMNDDKLRRSEKKNVKSKLDLLTV